MKKMTIKHHDGFTYTVEENSVYIDSNGDRHPIHFISRPEGCLVRVGKDNAVVLLKPTIEDAPWVVAHIGGRALYFNDADEAGVYLDGWLDNVFGALPE